MRFPKIFENKDKYRIIELEAENVDLRNDLITELKRELARLELENADLKSKLIDQTGTVVRKPVPQKPRMRTMSEVTIALENRSRRINAKSS